VIRGSVVNGTEIGEIGQQGWDVTIDVVQAERAGTYRRTVVQAGYSVDLFDTQGAWMDSRRAT